MKKIILSFAIVFLSAFVLVACGDNKNPDKPGVEDPKEFVWEGLEQRNVVRGDQVDLLDGVTVKQGDVDLTDKIIVLDDGGFTTHLADVYDVEFKVDGTDEVKTKKFAVSIGHNFGNGDFSMKQYNWSVDKPGGQFETEYKDNQANITITNAGTSWWSLQLYQRNISFTEGVTYKLTLRAKSSTGKSISVGYEDANNGFAMLNPGTQTIKLEEDFTNYVMYYTANSNFADLKAVIYLGHQFADDFLREGETHEVVIDNINIEVVNLDSSVTFEGVEDKSLASGSGEVDLLDGIVANKGDTDVTDKIKVLGTLPSAVRSNASFYVTYLLENEDGTVSFATKRFRFQLEKNNPFEVVNGDFDLGLVGWEQDVNQTDGTGKATFFENGDGTVSIKVEDPSSAGWHIQLQQSGAQLKAGQAYKVVLTIKASAARDVALEIVNPGDGFANLAPVTQVSVTEEWQTIEVFFSAEKNVNAKIGLLLGRNGNTANDIIVTVDELQVYEAEDIIAPEIDGVSDLVVTQFDEVSNWLKGITATDNIDGNVNVYIVENKVNLNVPGVYEITIGAKDNAENESTATIKVTVKELPEGQFVWKNIKGKTIEFDGDILNLINNIIVKDGESDISSTLTHELGEFKNNVAGDYEIIIKAGSGENIQEQALEVKVYPRHQVLNDNFENESNWKFDNLTDRVFEEGTLTVTFDETPGGNPWDHQIHQAANATLRKGETYKVTVRIKASVARTIRVWVEDAHRGFAGIANGENTELVIADEQVDTYIDFTYEFTSGVDTPNAKYVIMLGRAGEGVGAHTVTVDSFKVVHIQK